MLWGLLTLALIGFDWIAALKSTSGRGLAHGLAQLSGMGSNQSNLLTSLFIHFWPPNVFLPHLLTNWSRLPPLVLLFTSPFLLTTVIYSVTLTFQPSAIPNKPPPTDEAKMSVVLLLSLLLHRRRLLACQWEVILHTHQAFGSEETHCEMKQLTVWSTKAFQQLDRGDQTEHFTVDLRRAKTPGRTRPCSSQRQMLCLFGRDEELTQTSRIWKELWRSVFWFDTLLCWDRLLENAIACAIRWNIRHSPWKPLFSELNCMQTNPRAK